MCLPCLDLVHQNLPVIADDLQILVRELEQHCLVDRKVDLGHPIPVLIGHQQHTSTLHPECTGLEGLVVFLIIVQHIADQPLLGLNATRGLPIGRHLQFNARFLKIGSRVAIGLISKPAFLHNGTDGTLACCDAPSLVDLAQRFADCFLSTGEDFRFCLIFAVFHDTSLPPYKRARLFFQKNLIF